jgi:hypothetical protein
VNTDTLPSIGGNISASYYYIDDVSVQQVTSPTWDLRDTIVNLGDSVLIGPLYSGLTCNWFNMAGAPIGSGAAFYVKPTVNTSYILHQTFCSTTYADTVLVKVNTGSGIKENEFSKVKIYPNPVSNTLYISDPYSVFQNSVIEITNLFGQMILKQPYSNTVEVSSLAQGYYNLKITTSNKQTYYSKFLKE